MPFPVDIKYIHEAEQKLGVKFPASFVNHMVKHNSGLVRTDVDEFQLYPFLDSSDRKRLARTCNDIVRETKNCRVWTGFPPEAVAIGGNGGGDYLVLIPQTRSPQLLDHSVWWWDHETGELNLVGDDFQGLSI